MSWVRAGSLTASKALLHPRRQASWLPLLTQQPLPARVCSSSCCARGDTTHSAGANKRKRDYAGEDAPPQRVQRTRDGAAVKRIQTVCCTNCLLYACCTPK